MEPQEACPGPLLGVWAVQVTVRRACSGAAGGEARGGPCLITGPSGCPSPSGLIGSLVHVWWRGGWQHLSRRGSSLGRGCVSGVQMLPSSLSLLPPLGTRPEGAEEQPCQVQGFRVLIGTLRGALSCRLPPGRAVPPMRAELVLGP